MEADEGTAVEVGGSDPLRGAFGAMNNCISHLLLCNKLSPN